MSDEPGRAAGALNSTLAAVWDRFRGTMDARVDAVDRTARALAAGELDPELRREAEREAHKLAGAVGTFGFPEGSRLAREAEELLAGDAPLAESDAARLAALVAALRLDLARPAGQPPAALEQPAPPAPLILVVADGALVAGLQAEARSRGLMLHAVATPAEGRDALGERRPEVALLDLSSGTEEGRALLSALAAIDPPVPTVVLSDRPTFLERVEVVRLGGRALLIKPASPAVVLDALQRVMERASEMESTVLAVDDDQVVLDTIQLLLAPRGVRVHRIADPAHFWDALDAADPDVVILDVDMPAVNGLELCRVLRNDARWRSVPVLFLTASTDADTISRVFAAGADDFVAKPIIGPELVNRIANRLERIQLLRHLAETDPLTGVSNRRRSVEQLEQLIRLATRQGKPFSLAVLDLDDFKQVNDRWGHALGDEVLRRTARLLHRHFRGEDVVARWGGEEFVVGLFGMEKSLGIERLEALQARLAQERFGPWEAGFAVTFSAGIAQVPEDGVSVDELYHQADVALYRAKEAGRNRVFAAEADIGRPAP